MTALARALQHRRDLGTVLGKGASRVKQQGDTDLARVHLVQSFARSREELARAVGQLRAAAEAKLKPGRRIGESHREWLVAAFAFGLMLGLGRR